MSSKIAAPGTLWIAADIHLSAQASATRTAFLQFLDRASTQADALFLCGDIFDVWIGDDQAADDPPAWLADIVQGLQRTSARIPVWLGRGNRDFLLGESFARLTGARLLPDEVILQTDAGELLLTHGDQYCTDDRHYQTFRRIVRNRIVQGLYLALGLPTRRAIAAWARQRSMASNQHKTRDIMDVNPQAVVQALRANGVRTLVHGHTHRPADHVLQVDGQPCRRMVLSDWDLDGPGLSRQGWLQVDRHGIRALNAPALPADQGG